jgi:hypothetical protein
MHATPAIAPAPITQIGGAHVRATNRRAFIHALRAIPRADLPALLAEELALTRDGTALQRLIADMTEAAA